MLEVNSVAQPLKCIASYNIALYTTSLSTMVISLPTIALNIGD